MKIVCKFKVDAESSYFPLTFWPRPKKSSECVNDTQMRVLSDKGWWLGGFCPKGISEKCRKSSKSQLKFDSVRKQGEKFEIEHVLFLVREVGVHQRGIECKNTGYLTSHWLRVCNFVLRHKEITCLTKFLWHVIKVTCTLVFYSSLDT